MLTGTPWMALRRPDIGWTMPAFDVAREASVAAPGCCGDQEIEKRCHSRPRGGSSAAGSHPAWSPARTSTLATPLTDKAQPQTCHPADA